MKKIIFCILGAVFSYGFSCESQSLKGIEELTLSLQDILAELEDEEAAKALEISQESVE